MMRWLAIGLLVSAAVWGALLYWGPETRQVRLIHEEGNDMFCDFRMPRQCAQADNPYRAETVDKKDRCYPITGYVLAALFPEDFFRGGLIFTLAGWLAFVFAVEALLWLIVFCPLQIPLGDGAMNQSLANLALLALILRDFFGKIFVRNHVLPQ